MEQSQELERKEHLKMGCLRRNSRNGLIIDWCGRVQLAGSRVTSGQVVLGTVRRWTEQATGSKTMEQCSSMVSTSSVPASRFYLESLP